MMHSMQREYVCIKTCNKMIAVVCVHKQMLKGCMNNECLVFCCGESMPCIFKPTHTKLVFHFIVRMQRSTSQFPSPFLFHIDLSARANDGSHAQYDVNLDVNGTMKSFNVADIMLDARQRSQLKKQLGNITDNRTESSKAKLNFDVVSTQFFHVIHSYSLI